MPKIITVYFTYLIFEADVFREFNSLSPSDAIWWHWSGSALIQVMAWCLMAPSHYLNQCSLSINEVLWHAPVSNFTGTDQLHSMNYKIPFLKSLPLHSRTNESKLHYIHQINSCCGQGRITKPISLIMLFFQFWRNDKNMVNLKNITFILTDVARVYLQWHISNKKVIHRISLVLWQQWKYY